jgi:hemin uptake protein HemP
MRTINVCTVQTDPLNEATAPSVRIALSSDAAPRISSKALLGNRRELVIEHEGRQYRLRITQKGKLILTA